MTTHILRVTVFWWAFICLTTLASAQNAGSKQPNGTSSSDITVPDLRSLDTTAEMKAELASVGLKVVFTSIKSVPPSKDKEFKLATQFPPAGTILHSGDYVQVLIYPKYEGPPVPYVIGLNQKDAQAAFEKVGMNLNGIDVGTKPPSPDKAWLVFSQTPHAFFKIPDDKLASVKIYGTGKEPKTHLELEAASGAAFLGKWSGVCKVNRVNGPQSQFPTELEITRDGNNFMMKLEPTTWKATRIPGAKIILNLENEHLLVSYILNKGEIDAEIKQLASHYGGNDALGLTALLTWTFVSYRGEHDWEIRDGKLIGTYTDETEKKFKTRAISVLERKQ